VQVVSNLVSNACRYTPPGGHIEIVVETGADWVDLRVRDDGQGIAPDALPHVFELFAQSSGSDVGGKSGLGVGLTLVKELAELHGGRVRASSGGLGAGSEFVVTLPLASTPERSDAQVEAAVPASTGRQHRLLLVEDNDDSRETTVELLRLEGHEVVSAGDGATALNLAREFEPDVVLLDIGLPGMSGVEVARRLRAQSSAVPRIVALSGYGPRSGYCGAQAQAGARQDFDDYLTKPVTLEQLRRALT
jgi:CheY-like chemotaxis protein